MPVIGFIVPNDVEQFLAHAARDLGNDCLDLHSSGINGFRVDHDSPYLRMRCCAGLIFHADTAGNIANDDGLHAATERVNPQIPKPPAGAFTDCSHCEFLCGTNRKCPAGRRGQQIELPAGREEGLRRVSMTREGRNVVFKIRFDGVMRNAGWNFHSHAPNGYGRCLRKRVHKLRACPCRWTPNGQNSWINMVRVENCVFQERECRNTQFWMCWNES